MKQGAMLPAGYRLVARGTVDSTNSEAVRLAENGAADGTVVWAQRQTAGRGRHGRTWESPEGNVYCSLLLRLELPPSEAAQLSFVAALAIAEALDGEFVSPSRLAFKWPNDVLLDGGKVAGILLESSGSRNGRLDWLVIGCGLNVRQFPAVYGGYPAISLAAAGVEGVVLGDLLAAFIGAFARWRACWEGAGIGPIRDAWLARAAQVGGEVAVRLPDSELRGRFTGLDQSGAMLLDLPDGSRHTVTAGDVFF